METIVPTTGQDPTIIFIFLGLLVVAIIAFLLLKRKNKRDEE